MGDCLWMEVSFKVTVFSKVIIKLIIEFCRTGSRSEERTVIIRGGPTDGVIVSGARVRGSVRLRLACIAIASIR